MAAEDADIFDEIVELGRLYFDEVNEAMREYVWAMLSYANHLALARCGGSEDNPCYLYFQNYLEHLAEGVEDIEPKTLEALAFAASGSVDIQTEVATPKLQELGVTYWPKTAQALGADLVADMRPPN